MHNNKTEKIKSELILSCIKNEPKSFIPFLLSKNVQTEMPNKMLFYRFFKSMLNCAKESSEGKLTLKIEQPIWITNKEIVYFNFYDNVHKYSRLSIEVKENENQICLGIMPF